MTSTNTARSPRADKHFNHRMLAVATSSHLLRPMTRTIAGHLAANGSITAVEASAVYRARSLSRRIADLRDFGIEIKSEYRTDPTGQRYVRYVVE